MQRHHGIACSLLYLLMVTSMARGTEFLPPLAQYVDARIAEFDEIPAERREALLEIAEYVRSQREAGTPARLTFICTANSRRSQFGQAWAAVAASRYGVDEVESFSGGTEASAFNPRTVAALERAGVSIKRDLTAAAGSANPRYAVLFASKQDPLIFFSKRYDEKPNPPEEFCAVMVCSDADENCPSVPGAKVRVSLPYEDPKAADGTPGEAKAYGERLRLRGKYCSCFRASRRRTERVRPGWPGYIARALIAALSAAEWGRSSM
jgi:arsenate reductase (thioredoxin)